MVSKLTIAMACLGMPCLAQATKPLTDLEEFKKQAEAGRIVVPQKPPRQQRGPSIEQQRQAYEEQMRQIQMERLIREQRRIANELENLRLQRERQMMRGKR
jgi:hypothetical protein